MTKKATDKANRNANIIIGVVVLIVFTDIVGIVSLPLLMFFLFVFMPTILVAVITKIYLKMNKGGEK